MTHSFTPTPSCQDPLAATNPKTSNPVSGTATSTARAAASASALADIERWLAEQDQAFSAAVALLHEHAEALFPVDQELFDSFEELSDSAPPLPATTPATLRSGLLC